MYKQVMIAAGNMSRDVTGRCLHVQGSDISALDHSETKS